MKRACIVNLLLIFLSLPGALACEFKYDPISASQYYRAEGWSLPGIDGTGERRKKPVQSVPRAESIPLAQLVPHESPDVVDFPAQDFWLNGKRQRMRAARAEVNILRWVMHRRTVAYSYKLIPVTAHREDGKWIIDATTACIYFATFVDDRGDGIFRVLVPDQFTATLVPRWAKSTRN